MISIIVPVYKVEPYLRQCIESILNQTYKDIEVLLIDDGSPDCCGKICDEYAKQDSRIITFHTENRGLSAARNYGIKEARGEYIGFVDSDDWIEPNMYEVLFNNMSNTNADICMCNHWYDFDTTLEKSHFPNAIYNAEEALEVLIDGKTISNAVWNKLYRKTVFSEITFPVDREFEDIAIMHKLFAKCKTITVIDSINYHYRQRQGSIIRNHTAKNLIDGFRASYDRYHFYEDEQSVIFNDKKEEMYLFIANHISRVWRWWHGCSKSEKELYKGIIKELKSFSKEHFPLIGYPEWPWNLRISSIFMHSDSNVSFSLLYWINIIYRRFQLNKKLYKA